MAARQCFHWRLWGIWWKVCCGKDLWNS